jgi:hypothetical protein
MFYFLIFNSSISKSDNINKRLITTLLYGTVLYIFTHAILSTQDKAFFKIVKQYFIFLVCIDLICSIYMYCEKCNLSQDSTNIFNIILDKLSYLLENKLTPSTSHFEYDDTASETETTDTHTTNTHPTNTNNTEPSTQLPSTYLSKDTNTINTNQGILKKRVSFADDIDIDNLNSPTSIKKEISDTVNEIHKINNDLLNIQLDTIHNINNKYTNDTNNNLIESKSTDINTIRKLKQLQPLQTPPLQHQPQQLPTQQLPIQQTPQQHQPPQQLPIQQPTQQLPIQQHQPPQQQLPQPIKDIKDINNSLMNINMQYNPNIDNSIKSNLSLDNFREDANINISSDTDKTVDVNKQYKPIATELSNNDIKQNFQEQMEKFNKEKAALLESTLKKNAYQQDAAYNANNTFNINNNTIDNDTQSTVSSASDVGSIFDLDMNDFANTLS